ncbi:MAG: glycosyltransferase family 4 protein [Thermodesulfobacteriota bacterium]
MKATNRNRESRPQKAPSFPVLGLILKGYPRISETFISNEILGLERLGFHIRIFSMRQPRESFCHASVRRIRARADYLPEMLAAAPLNFFTANALLAFCRPKRYAAAFMTALRRYRRTRKAATWKHLLQAGYLVKRLAPDAGVTHLHAHFAHSPASVAMFASLLSGIPYSFTAHAKDIYTSDPEQLREKISRAKMVVTCTEYNRRHLLALSAGIHTPIHRSYHGIDTGMFAPEKSSNQPPGPPFRILTVARLIPKKGLPTVYHAVKRIQEQGLAVEHDLIGDGDDRDKILGLIAKLGLSSIARWRGTLPHHQVLEYYKRADLFVLGCEIAPNGDRDGIPNVLIESMAMGVPVVATTVSAIPELVVHGRTGLLVSPGEPEEMARAMTTLLTDNRLRNTIISEARQAVRKKFDNRTLIHEMAELYGRVMETRIRTARRYG